MGFGIGCDCHCGCTLYRVDPVTGEILWKVNRRVSEWQLRADRTRVITLGLTPGDHEDGFLISWEDLDTRAAAQWYATQGAFSGVQTGTGGLKNTHPIGNREGLIFNSDASVIWGVGRRLGSWNADTGQQIGQYDGANGPTMGQVTSDGSVLVANGDDLYASTRVGPKRFDTTCNLVASSTFNTGTSHDMCWAGGWLFALHGFDQTPSHLPAIHRFDNALNRTDFFPDGVTPALDPARPTGNITGLCLQPCSGGLVFLVERRFFPFRRWLLGLTFDLVETWSVETTTEILLGGVATAFVVADDDVYMREGAEVVRRSGTDGSVVWRSDPGLNTGFFGIQDIKVGSDFVMVCGVRGGDPLRSAVCLERSSGAVRWGTLHGNGDISIEITPDDRVYIVSGTPDRAEEVDLV